MATKTSRSPMLSIDFGNSYTKVAIRGDRNEVTKAYDERTLQYDEDKICIPTLTALVTDASGRDRWYFGTQVALLKDTPRVRVYRNW
jgi:hypothetical protein